MKLITVPGVFRPRSDSLLLAERVRERVRPGERVLDPFTGSGVLAIAAAQAGGDATAIDVSRRAVACAWLNGRLNGVRVRALHGDMFGPVAGERFDLVIANPPYVPAVEDERPRGAARAWDAGLDGRAILNRFCREVAEMLVPGGRVLLIHSTVCDAPATEATLAEHGLEVDIIDRRRGGFGPLVAERAEVLERRGIIEPGQREEEMLVFAARREP